MSLPPDLEEFHPPVELGYPELIALSCSKETDFRNRLLTGYFRT